MKFYEFCLWYLFRDALKTNIVIDIEKDMIITTYSTDTYYLARQNVHKVDEEYIEDTLDEIARERLGWVKWEQYKREVQMGVRDPKDTFVR